MKIIKQIFKKIYFWTHEHKWEGRLKFIFSNNHSSTLVIVFSGFPNGEKPVYNYVKTLKKARIDKLFILDDFGYRGSYYLLENGLSTPQDLCRSLIQSIIGRGNYSCVYTLGSSKGGTAAIYYGLQFNVTAIYSGACQYYIGDYLSRLEYEPIVKGMTGTSISSSVIRALNEYMPDQLRKYANSNTIVHLLYSKDEHTYEEHIVDLIKDLKNNNITFTEKIENFPEHSQVGAYFSKWIKQELER